VIEADSRHRHLDGWEYTFAGVRACSETSAFGAFDPSKPFRHQNRDARMTKSPHDCPSVGNDTGANVAAHK
jgi:hypothetical protein